MPRKADRPQVLQVIGGNPPNVLPLYLPNIPQIQAGPDPLTTAILNVSSNPYLIGVFYMFLNLGGRFLSLELTKRQEWFLGQPYVRPFILFAVLFIATRNLAVAFYTTIGILSVLWVFANENSSLCLIPGWRVVDDYEKDKAYTETMNKLQKPKVE